MTNIAMENHHAINGKIHYNWQFSIAMFVYRRVALPLACVHLQRAADTIGLAKLDQETLRSRDYATSRD